MQSHVKGSGWDKQVNWLGPSQNKNRRLSSPAQAGLEFAVQPPRWSQKHSILLPHPPECWVTATCLSYLSRSSDCLYCLGHKHALNDLVTREDDPGRRPGHHMGLSIEYLISLCWLSAAWWPLTRSRLLLPGQSYWSYSLSPQTSWLVGFLTQAFSSLPCRTLGLWSSGQAKWIVLIIELGKQRQGVRSEFKVSLVYLVRSRLGRATKWNLVKQKSKWGREVEG